MAIFLREDDVRRLLPMAEAIEAVEDGFREQGGGTGVNLPRERAQAQGRGLTMMVAALGRQGVAGFKAMGAGTPLVLLYGDEPRRLLVVMEAGALGQIRTGAATGVATRHMAQDHAHTVAVIGTGHQAETQLAAICAVRPIQTVRAYSRTRERLEAFCHTMSASLAVEVAPAPSAEEAVRGSDIAVAITNVRTLEPVLLGEWLSPGMHLVAAGANSLSRRELDDDAVERSGVIVADARDQARLECADLVIPVARGLLNWERVWELGQVVAGQVPGRNSAEEITLFESQGIALEDVAAAAHVYQRAQAEGAGDPLPF